MRIIALSLLKCRSPPILNGGGGGEWKKCPLSNAFTYTSTKKSLSTPIFVVYLPLFAAVWEGQAQGQKENHPLTAANWGSFT